MSLQNLGRRKSLSDFERGVIDDILRLNDRMDDLEAQEFLTPGFGLTKLQEKTGASAGYSFTGISGSHGHLLMIAYLRSDRAAVSNDNLELIFNGDTGSNYEWVHMRWSHDTGAVGGNEFSQGASADSHIEVGFIEAAAAPSDVFSPNWILIPNYANATDHKNCISQTGFQTATYAAEQISVDIGHGLWHTGTPAAITQIDLNPEIGTNWVAGSRATLYGLA